MWDTIKILSDALERNLKELTLKSLKITVSSILQSQNGSIKTSFGQNKEAIFICSHPCMFVMTT
jgi:hypothetical protein